MIIKPGEYYGKCPQCGGPMFVYLDFEKRKIAICSDCRAQLPVEDGLYLIEKRKGLK